MCEGMVEAAPEPNPPLLPLLPVFIYIQHFMQNVGVGVEMFFFFFFFHPQSEWVWLKKKPTQTSLKFRPSALEARGRCTERLPGCWGGKWDGGTPAEQILSLIPNFLGDFQAEEQLRNLLENPQPAPSSGGRSSLTAKGFWSNLWGEFGVFHGGVCREELPNGVPVSRVALQDLSLQGQGGGGRDGGAESSGGSADRQDHCQRVLAFLPAQGERSVQEPSLPPPAPPSPPKLPWLEPSALDPHQSSWGGKAPWITKFGEI